MLYFIYIRPDRIRSAYSPSIFSGTNEQQCLEHNLGFLGGGIRMGGEVRSGPRACKCCKRGTWIGSETPKVALPSGPYTILGVTALWALSRFAILKPRGNRGGYL